MNVLEELFRHWEQRLQRRHLWANVGPFGAREPPNHRGGALAWPIDEADVERVSEAFARMADATGLPVAIVLSDEPAEAESTAFYVQYEPCADHVFALSTRERRSSLCTHEARWKKQRRKLLAIQERIDAHLRADRIVDALLACVDEIGTVSRL